MAEPIINPSPKQQFLANPKRVSAHRELMQNPQMQDSLNMGLLHYQLALAANMTDANAAAANSFKVKGVLEFIDVFLKLGESSQAPTQSKIVGLDHSV